jgi:hypothetical protein
MPRDALTPEQEAEQAKYEKLPTGKPHVSFSELRDWRECSYRHKLKFIDKINADLPGIHLDFGTSIHEACENYLKTRVMDRKIFLVKLKELWAKHTSQVPEEFTVEQFQEFGKQGMSILNDVPKWLDEQFPGWECIDAEHALYEPLPDNNHAFKGYIDAIIKAPGPKGKPLVWLLDWKTCSWGWNTYKKSDELVRSQLVLYKNFWSIKTNHDPRDVRCGFALLKRTAKPGKHCELVTTAVGDVTTGKSLAIINNMVMSVKRGIAIKNRNSCQYCDFYTTPHCT